MTTDPESCKPKKSPDVCPFCGEPTGEEHKKICGLWSPYSNSQWVKAKPETPAIVVQVHKCWPFPQSMV